MMTPGGFAPIHGDDRDPWWLHPIPILIGIMLVCVLVAAVCAGHRGTHPRLEPHCFMCQNFVPLIMSSDQYHTAADGTVFEPIKGGEK